MSPGSLSFAKLVMMSSAPAKSAGDARYASQDSFIQSTLSHTISTPVCIRSAFFLRRTQKEINGHRFRVRFFGKIRIRIFDPRSLGSWCIKGTDESTLGEDSSVPLMHHYPSDLGSKIRIRIFPKKRTLSLNNFCQFFQ